MGSDAFLLSFGMKPGDSDRSEGPKGTDDGLVHDAWEARKAPGGSRRTNSGSTPRDAKMEAGNDVAQTMIDAAYGHRDFEEFRKRLLLMGKNAKRQKGTRLDTPFAQPPCGYSFGRLIFAQPP